MFVFSLGVFPELTKRAASLPVNVASPINAGAFAMIFTLTIVPIISLFTKKLDKKNIDEIFKCYK